jgi:hypothetical protein
MALENSPNTPAAEPNAPAGQAAPAGHILEAADSALCLQAFQQLRTGLSQALLYTLESKQFEKAAENAFGPLQTLLEKIGEFKLNMLNGDALVNGSRVEIPASKRPVIEALEKVMSSGGISCLRFEPGLAMNELGRFLHLLARKGLGSSDGAKINQLLREKGITHVRTEELRYVMIGAGEKVVSADAPGVANAEAQNVISHITTDCAVTVSRIGDAVAREQMRAEVAEQLLEQDPELLGSMLAVILQRLKDSAHEKFRPLVALPQRDGQLLGETLQVARLLAQNGRLENKACAAALKELIAHLAAPYRHRAEDVLANLPFAPECSGLLPEWLEQAYASTRGGTAQERLEGILSLSPQILLEEKLFRQIVDVLDELAVARMEAEAEKLMRHVSGALRALTKGERIKAVKLLSFLLEHLMEQSSAPVQVLENALLEACTHETCGEVMSLLLKHLRGRCVHHYRLGNFERALEHLRWIASLEENSRLTLQDEGENLARQAREELARSPFAAQLAQDCLATGEKGKVAAQLAAILKTGVWEALLERMCTESDPQILEAQAGLLKSAGPEAVRLFFSTLGQRADLASALCLLSLGPALDEGLFWKQFPPLLRHEDESVRARALAWAAAHDCDEAATLLAGVLREEAEPARRAPLLAALARLASPAAAATLSGELEAAAEAGGEARLLAALETLKAVHKDDFVPGVLKLAASRYKSKIPSASLSKPVTLAAIKALARFYKQQAVSETLERLRRDSDPDVSRLALVALRGILAAEQEEDLKKAALPPAGAQVPAPASQPSSAPRKAHRRFEELEAQINADKVFKIGAEIGAPPPAKNPRPEEGGSQKT